jgi:hypothetical protein
MFKSLTPEMKNATRNNMRHVLFTGLDAASVQMDNPESRLQQCANGNIINQVATQQRLVIN